MATVKEQNKGLALADEIERHPVTLRLPHTCKPNSLEIEVDGRALAPAENRLIIAALRREPATEAVLEIKRSAPILHCLIAKFRGEAQEGRQEIKLSECADTLQRILDTALHASPWPELGMVMAPKEPTREMESAGFLRSQKDDIFGGVGALTFADCAKIYRAMVEAAPLQQPEEPKSE